MPHETELDVAAELRATPEFSEVAKEAIAELSANATQRRVHTASALIEQGLVSPALVVLLRGAAKMMRNATPDGESVVVLDVMRGPALIADSSVLDGQAATSSVITLRSSQVAFIDRRVVARAAATHPTLARALLLRFAQEVRAHVRRIDEVVGGPVDERIKHLLDSLAEQHGTPLGQGRFIAIPLRRRDLACMVNATTETVSRLLARFERDGLARSTRDGIWWRTPRPVPAAPVSDVAPAPNAPVAPSSTSQAVGGATSTPSPASNPGRG